MAKIDDDLAGLVAGFANPEIRFGTTWVTDEFLVEQKLRRRVAGATHHNLWYLIIGETGAPAPHATFWGHKFTDVLILAMKWRGTYVKHSKGPKKAQAAA